MQRQFLWNNKTPKINYSILIAPYKQIGLNDVHIESRIWMEVSRFHLEQARDILAECTWYNNHICIGEEPIFDRQLSDIG